MIPNSDTLRTYARLAEEREARLRVEVEDARHRLERAEQELSYAYAQATAWRTLAGLAEDDPPLGVPVPGGGLVGELRPD